MKSFSFIHAADLHLGSPFKGVGAALPDAADRLRSAPFEAFDALIRLALAEQVDFLLVAGDVFDYADRSLKAQLAFRDGLAKLAAAGIRSFVVLGNHDPADAWSSRMTWPEGVHVFPAESVESQVVSVNGEPSVIVTGISYRTRKETRALAGRFKAVRPDLFQIAMLHCTCDGLSGHETYAACAAEELRSAGFDYWALGHVHTPTVLSTAPHIVYPGCLQGLSIRETGPRGCRHVTVSDTRQTELAFIPLDRLRWKQTELSIAGLASLDDLDRALADTLDKLREEADGRPMITRVKLTGRGPLYPELKGQGAIDELSERLREIGENSTPPVWVEKLEAEVLPDADLAKRARVDDLLGQVLSQAEALEQAPDALATQMAPALADLYGHARIGRMLTPLTPEDYHAFLQEAALTALDLLEPTP